MPRVDELFPRRVVPHGPPHHERGWRAVNVAVEQVRLKVFAERPGAVLALVNRRSALHRSHRNTRAPPPLNPVNTRAGPVFGLRAMAERSTTKPCLIA